MSKKTGGFTLPGEAGYEKLTLKLADLWGADVIRDSDGTKLSQEIIDAGYGIYSTVCVIRDHNEWAKQNKDKLQQTFLKSKSHAATGRQLKIALLEGYYPEQFKLNDSKNGMKYWQVHDRTENRELEPSLWSYDKQAGAVIIEQVKKWHTYSVNFLAYRIWEEISMYNHVTNGWNKEHSMPIEPRYKETQDYLLNWMKQWCEAHKETTVVRFTSLFYNFVWIWGANERCRNIYTDWGSYDFTVSDLALDDFEKEYGYRLTGEDFINQGKLHASHMPADKKKRDWMSFTNAFVISFGRQLIDIVHSFQKKAYVFYDDSWVGMEPYNGRFKEFGFDGIIKCVFNGYEARLCADVPAETHEIRLHPYLFPTGLGNNPTFSEGGTPTLDAKDYWIKVRRALVRKPVERIGLGGYLHLLEAYPDFVNYIEALSDEFRYIAALHQAETPYTEPVSAAVLHSWGRERSWTLSGHFHETDKNDLIHVNEALSGYPMQVSFLNFEDVLNEDLENYQIIINAGFAGSAWSGGSVWDDPAIMEKLTEWVWNGGIFFGINEPSATEGYENRFRMAPVLGVDVDFGEHCCHGRLSYQICGEDGLNTELLTGKGKTNLYLTEENTKVLSEDANGNIILTSHEFGKGRGLYLSGFQTGCENNRFLLSLLLHSAHVKEKYSVNNPYAECAVFERTGKAVVINNSTTAQKVHFCTPDKSIELLLEAAEMKTIVI
ncbi:MAG: 1,3-beta-galactosyl-N-acetylhexosamine phosphorylase [Lachnospiraceae bacterium]